MPPAGALAFAFFLSPLQLKCTLSSLCLFINKICLTTNVKLYCTMNRPKLLPPEPPSPWTVHPQDCFSVHPKTLPSLIQPDCLHLDCCLHNSLVTFSLQIPCTVQPWSNHPRLSCWWSGKIAFVQIMPSSRFGGFIKKLTPQIHWCCLFFMACLEMHVITIQNSNKLGRL